MPPPLNSLTLCALAIILTLAAGPGAQADALVARALVGHEIEAYPESSDQVFLRRTYLDAVGRISTKDETLRFLASKEPAERAALIDTLPGSVMIGSDSQHPGPGFFESRFSPLTIKDPRAIFKTAPASIIELFVMHH